MGYTLISYDNKIEVHSDMCDEVFDKKDDFEFNNKAQYLNFALFEEVEEFLENNKDVEIIFCENCKPENKEYDEEYDDFYEEFDDEDEEIGDSCCII